jgi:hypothetical protein
MGVSTTPDREAAPPDALMRRVAEEVNDKGS